MDDEEYSCIVSGAGGAALALEWFGVHMPLPARLTGPQECPGPARDTGWGGPAQERPGGLARLLFVEICGLSFPPFPGLCRQCWPFLRWNHPHHLLPDQQPSRLGEAPAGKKNAFPLTPESWFF